MTEEHSELTIELLANPEIDHRELTELVSRLRGELVDLDVEDVEPPTDGQALTSAKSTPPTQRITVAPVTLRVACVAVAAAVGSGFAERDAVADGDCFRSDEDVFDQQAQHPLAFADAGAGAAAQLGEEAVEVVGELEGGIPVDGLGVEGGQPGAEARFAGAQVRAEFDYFRRVHGAPRRTIWRKVRFRPNPHGSHRGRMMGRGAIDDRSHFGRSADPSGQQQVFGGSRE